jgi:hypothetical protein
MLRIVALGMAVMACCTLPSQCFVLPGSASPAPRGCHGHHSPAPQPAHSCCFIAHQYPSATQPAPSMPGLVCVSHSSGNPDRSSYPVAAIQRIFVSDASPPLASVLRI